MSSKALVNLDTLASQTAQVIPLFDKPISQTNNSKSDFINHANLRSLCGMQTHGRKPNTNTWKCLIPQEHPNWETEECPCLTEVLGSAPEIKVHEENVSYNDEIHSHSPWEPELDTTLSFSDEVKPLEQHDAEDSEAIAGLRKKGLLDGVTDLEARVYVEQIRYASSFRSIASKLQLSGPSQAKRLFGKAKKIIETNAVKYASEGKYYGKR